MKKVNILLAVLILTGSTVFAKAPVDKSSVHVLSTKRDIFFFKVCDSLIGATVEVFDNDGNQVMTEQIVEHKTILDFYFEKPGVYNIRIVKGTHTEEFGFVKSAPSAFVESSTDYHMSMTSI